MPDTLNPNVRGLGRSATLAIRARSRALAAEGREIFQFGFGQSPFPVPHPVVDALRQHAAVKDYLPVEGLPALREAVAGYHARVDGLEIRPDDVVIGPGSKDLMFLLQLALGGETVVSAPAWVSYVPQARILGRRVLLIQTSFDDQWKLTPGRLRAALREAGGEERPRLLILNYPSNPAGQTYGAGELEAMAAVAREVDLIVLSDEIYGPTHFLDGHVSIARYCPERTIVSSGLSKWCGAGGWRLGTFAFPPGLAWLRDAVMAVASESYTSVSAPIQHAAVAAFSRNPEIDRYLAGIRRILAAVAERSVDLLVKAGVGVHRPAGAFYLFLDFSPLTGRLADRGIRTGAALCEDLLTKAGVALLPGVDFGQPAENLTARLSFVDFDGAAALDLVARMAAGETAARQVAAAACGRVFRGIEALTTHLH